MSTLAQVTHAITEMRKNGTYKTSPGVFSSLKEKQKQMLKNISADAKHQFKTDDDTAAPWSFKITLEVQCMNDARFAREQMAHIATEEIEQILREQLPGQGFTLSIDPAIAPEYTDPTKVTDALALCVKQLKLWMKDHGEDRESQEAIAAAKAAIVESLKHAAKTLTKSNLCE